MTCTSTEEYVASPRADGLTVVRVEPDLRRDLVRLGPDGRERQVLFPSLTTVGSQLWLDDTTAVRSPAARTACRYRTDPS